jgi:hypothetical protein|nr:MAG TPA: hypothetical protein [Caudoviricetes sp.]
MSFLNNETIHIISMIVCIVGAIVFIFTDSENLASSSPSASSLFGIMVLILIGFVPIINIMVATILILLFIISLLTIIFERIKK